MEETKCGNRKETSRVSVSRRTSIVDFILKQDACDFIRYKARRFICIGRVEVEVVGEGAGLDCELEGS